MKARRDVFQAIADPTRRAIIGLLAGQTLTLNAVAENFKISQPAVSKHMRILVECGPAGLEVHLCQSDLRFAARAARGGLSGRHRSDGQQKRLLEECATAAI